MQYELFYLVGASKEAELDKIKADAAEIITSEGGEFSEKQVIEKRRLAYEVKHETHGFYVAQRFNLEDAEKLKTITRKLNLYTGILRFLISRADELPELKTKEERIQQFAEKQIREEKITKKEVVKEPTAKEAAAIKSSQETAPKVDEKPEAAVNTEDIDKKLEEILNI